MTDVINEREIINETPDSVDRSGVTRRNVLRAGAVGVAAVGLGAGKVLMQPSLQRRGFLSPEGVFGAASQAAAAALYDEEFPTSPLILNPFSDPLVIPRPSGRSARRRWRH